MLFSWPTYEPSQAVDLEPDHEGRPVGMVVGNYLVTERHAAGGDGDDSSLWVLALPTFEEKAVIPWVSRGFGKVEDDAGLEFVDAVGSDSFLESRRDDDGSYALRIWRLID